MEKSWNGYLLESVTTVINCATNVAWRGRVATAMLIDTVYQKGVKLFGKEKKWANLDPDTINERIFEGSNNCRKETNKINEDFFATAEKLKKDLIWDKSGRHYKNTTNTIQIVSA